MNEYYRKLADEFLRLKTATGMAFITSADMLGVMNEIRSCGIDIRQYEFISAFSSEHTLRYFEKIPPFIDVKYRDKEICRQLGVEGGMTSPTFAIVNEYWTRDGEPLYHFDFYRIDTPDDATRIGFQDYLYSGNYCFIEWTDKVESLLHGEYTPVTIERIDDQTRKFTF